MLTRKLTGWRAMGRFLPHPHTWALLRPDPSGHTACSVILVAGRAPLRSKSVRYSDMLRLS